LIEFLFVGKDIRDQEFRASEKYGYQSFFMAIVVYFRGGTSARDFAWL
jgi:hypothetical protein